MVLTAVSSWSAPLMDAVEAGTIHDPRDRIATSSIAPFMACSARLPVYAMVVAALFPPTETVLGFLPTGAVVVIAMYLVGIAAGVARAGILRRALLRGGRSRFSWNSRRTVCRGRGPRPSTSGAGRGNSCRARAP